MLLLSFIGLCSGMAINPRLPAERLIIGYATSRALREDSVVPACLAGVNVVIWSFAHMEVDDESGNPTIRETFNLEDIAATKRRIGALGLDVCHLVAFGGWNGPHPSTRFKGSMWWDTFRAWNDNELFDGVDWDLEGHDNPEAPTCILSAEVEEIVLTFTTLARSAGFVVAVAPPESYLDAKGDGSLSRRLNLQPLAPWGAKIGDFPYAGRNAYARLLARTHFDFVSVQFYEGYSRACYETTQLAIPLADYLVDVVARFAVGFDVTDTADGSVFSILVPPSNLVLGFANAWTDGEKFLRADPNEIARAFARLRQDGLEPRGTMFWVIDEEGTRDVRFAPQLKFAFSRLGLLQSNSTGDNAVCDGGEESHLSNQQYSDRRTGE